MELQNVLKKTMALFLVVCFLTLIQTSSSPLYGENNSTEAEAPTAIEKPSGETAEVNGKSILPWILVGVGVVAIGVLTYFLFIKKSDDNLREDFTSEASGKWLPRFPANWAVANGCYRCNTVGVYNDWSVYNQAWSQANYTVTLRTNTAIGPSAFGNIIMLSTTNDPTNFSGYTFEFYHDGDADAWIMTNYNYLTGSGDVDWLAGLLPQDYFNTGINVWNKVKIVKSGATYTMYIDEEMMFHFTDTHFDPRYLILMAWADGLHLTQVLYDYVYVDVGATSSSVPAPLTPFQSLNQSPFQHHGGRLLN